MATTTSRQETRASRGPSGHNQKETAIFHILPPTYEASLSEEHAGRASSWTGIIGRSPAKGIELPAAVNPPRGLSFDSAC